MPKKSRLEMLDLLNVRDKWNLASFGVMTLVNLTGNLYPILNARLVRRRCILMLARLELRDSHKK